MNANANLTWRRQWLVPTIELLVHLDGLWLGAKQLHLTLPFFRLLQLYRLRCRCRLWRSMRLLRACYARRMQRTSRKCDIRCRCRIHPVDAHAAILIRHPVRSESHWPRHWRGTHRLTSCCRRTSVTGRWYGCRPRPVVLGLLLGISCLRCNLARVQVALSGHGVPVPVHRRSRARQTGLEVALRALSPVVYVHATVRLAPGHIRLAACDDWPREVMRIGVGRSDAAQW